MNIAGGAMAIDYYSDRGDSDYVKAGMAMGVSSCFTLISTFIS